MSVILLRPAAQGGLAAHVDVELEALRAAGVAADLAPQRIQERPDPRRDLATVRSLARMLRRERPVALHAHGLRAGALAALAPRGTTRLVVTLHNLPVGSRAVRLIGAVLLRIAARRADVVLAVSPDLAQAARAAGARDVRHALIPAPAEAAPAVRSSAPGATEQVTAKDGRAPLSILVIARLAPQKDLDTLLDAVARLRAAGTDLQVRIAGAGPLRARLQERISAEGLPVVLLGHRQDVLELLREQPLVVSSARWEGQPVALQQALRAGCAIVATDAGGTRWVTGNAARLVPVGDPAALAKAIAQMQDPTTRAQAQEASARRALELPALEDMTGQLLEVLGVQAQEDTKKQEETG